MQTCNCLSHRCPRCSESQDESFLEEHKLSDLAADIRQSNRTYLTERAEFAPDSRQDMPEEYKGTPTDGWWSVVSAQLTKKKTNM